MEIKKTNGKKACKEIHLAANDIIERLLIYAKEKTNLKKKEIIISVIGNGSEENKKEIISMLKDIMSESDLDNLYAFILASITWKSLCFVEDYDFNSVQNYFSYLLEIE